MPRNNKLKCVNEKKKKKKLLFELIQELIQIVPYLRSKGNSYFLIKSCFILIDIHSISEIEKWALNQT